MPQIAPFGSWLSPITPDLIVAQSISLGGVWLDGEDLYWIEGRPQERGRTVLVRRHADGNVADVNGPQINVRTRVHEYGGGAVTFGGGSVYVSNFSDQRLYRLTPGAPPTPLTPPAPEGQPERSPRYADGRIDAARKLWIGVRQDHRGSVDAPENTLVAIDLAAGGEGRVWARGHDFFSNPRLSPDGKRLAWLTWNHPNMPWVGTELWVAEIGDAGPSELRRVAGGPSESVCQPEWAPDGALYFVSDRSGWWNLYRAEPSGTGSTGGPATPICPRAAEFGQPQWNFGGSTYAFLSAREVVCAYTEGGRGWLARLDLASGELQPFNLPYHDFGSVVASDRRVAFRAGSPTSPSAIVLLDWHTRSTTVVRNSGGDDPAIRPYFTRAEPIEFPTDNNRTAFALYYPPANPDFAAPAGELPPLVVKCHGGPTSSATRTLSLGTQFWTSRGVAVVDVDYGGSAGYGREYRGRLELGWGIVDVQDCAAAVRFLAERRLIDPRRVIITGGSAGGYTALACLTAADSAIRQTFCAGGSHFGVSDLEALAKDTHKFESRYLDWLIGPYPQAQARYRELSPVNHADRLTVPMAFFQGAEDKVVPPDQTERMVEAVRKNGMPALYLLFAGEQHGFRQAANIKRALEAELQFYAALAFKVDLRF